MRGFVSCLFLAASYFAFAATPAVLGIDWAKKDKEFAAAIQPILKQACLDCHSGAEADGGLALSHFQTAKSILKERTTWQKVLQRIELGDMPPQDATPLEKEAKQKLIDWIRSTINDIECGLTPNPGSVTLRRLNRVEYQNTIRDLLGVDYKPASGFPGDDVGYGFDNIGDVLALPLFSWRNMSGLQKRSPNKRSWLRNQGQFMSPSSNSLTSNPKGEETRWQADSVLLEWQDRVPGVVAMARGFSD